MDEVTRFLERTSCLLLFSVLQIMFDMLSRFVVFFFGGEGRVKTISLYVFMKCLAMFGVLFYRFE